MDRLFVQTYKNKKVLITGHTGFKGGWLSVWLVESGAQVIGYSLEPPTDPSLFEAIGLQNRITHIIGDVRDEKRLTAVFNEYQPEFVFHLAAQPLVRFSYKEPKLTYETNIIGTVNVLECVRKTASVRVCVIVTSDKCYENKEWVFGYRETDPMGGYDPYSSSKGCAELVTAAYRNSFFNPIDCGTKHRVALSSARAGNVIGGGDWREDRIIPDCMKALSKGETIVIRNPMAVRPWQYVLEPLSGYLLLGNLMDKDLAAYSDAWNFGPNPEGSLSVEQLVKIVIEQWGEGTFTKDSLAHPHEVGLLRLDISKATMFLGWKPIYTIAEAIRRTISWYMQFYQGGNAAKLYKLAVAEINEYEDRMSKCPKSC